MFKITDYIEFNASGRASCPVCEPEKGKNTNLSLHPNGGYYCFRKCSIEDIRAAIGAPKDQQVPTALATSKSSTVSPQKVKEAHDRLMESNGPAKQWLHDRGIDDGLIVRYQLGISRAKAGEGKQMYPAITIPIPNHDGTAYWQKKRVAPWIPKEDQPHGYKPWSQWGIPARAFFTWLPAEATEIWLCEGEWDAILLGNMLRQADAPIAVASFTCGCGTVPGKDQLDLLPGTVTIWYDRNDTPDKQGNRPGEVGAQKLAIALGNRAKIGQVPMPNDCTINGWDVTDAIKHGFALPDFYAAAGDAQPFTATTKPDKNPLRDRMVTTDQLIARAPDFQEWLVPDLLTNNELFGLAAPPRGGKSLMCMLLAKAIATGEKFLERPVVKGSVIYVNLEDPDVKIKERTVAQQWREGLPIYWIDKFKLHELPHLIEIADEMEDLRLIILDTFSRIRSDDKNENAAEMSLVIEPLQEYAKTRNVTILLVHHTGKLNPDRNSLDELFDSVRGSGAIRATCRGLLVIAPGDNCYRLAVENGWGKHDLKIRLDAATSEWKLLGKWQPPEAPQDQKSMVIDCLNKLGSGTIDQIAAETNLPKRSLWVVLNRLVDEEVIKKEGNRQSAIYVRPIQQIQQLNSLLNSTNADGESDRHPIQQKTISSISKEKWINQGQVDHSCNRNDDPLSPNDPLFTDTPFVELTRSHASSPDSVSDSAIQQQFNNDSTVELKPKLDQFAEGDPVWVLHGDRWTEGEYVRLTSQQIVCSTAPGLHPAHLVLVHGERARFTINELRIR